MESLVRNRPRQNPSKGCSRRYLLLLEVRNSSQIRGWRLDSFSGEKPPLPRPPRVAPDRPGEEKLPMTVEAVPAVNGGLMPNIRNKWPRPEVDAGRDPLPVVVTVQA